MKRSPLIRKTPMSRATAPIARTVMAKTSKPMKSHGMKGIAPTSAQKAFHDAMASIGCIACFTMGAWTEQVLIHHIDGRTKPEAQWKVLPLCAGHHDHNTGIPGLIAVHPYKARFQAAHGHQMVLLRTCLEILIDEGKYVHPDAIRAAELVVEA
jgi:hypothetical protein